MNNTNSNQNKNFIASKNDEILDDLTLLEKLNLDHHKFIFSIKVKSSNITSFFDAIKFLF